MEEDTSNIIAPRSEKQKKFLDSTASITIFGGEICAS